MSELSRTEFEQKLADLVAQNPEVRAKLISDPKSVIGEMLGMELPEEMKVVAHEEDANTLHFVLPPADDELSSAELAAVAGGVCWEHEVSYGP